MNYNRLSGRKTAVTGKQTLKGMKKRKKGIMFGLLFLGTPGKLAGSVGDSTRMSVLGREGRRPIPCPAKV